MQDASAIGSSGGTNSAASPAARRYPESAEAITGVPAAIAANRTTPKDSPPREGATYRSAPAKTARLFRVVHGTEEVNPRIDRRARSKPPLLRTGPDDVQIDVTLQRGEGLEQDGESLAALESSDEDDARSWPLKGRSGGEALDLDAVRQDLEGAGLPSEHRSKRRSCIVRHRTARTDPRRQPGEQRTTAGNQTRRPIDGTSPPPADRRTTRPGRPRERMAHARGRRRDRPARCCSSSSTRRRAIARSVPGNH